MSEQKNNADVASRRHLLKLGAMAAPAVITLAPGSARAAASILNCRVPFPDYVDKNGNPCSGPSGQSTGQANTGLGFGNASDTGNANANANAFQNNGRGRPGRPGGGGQGGGGQEENICYDGPGEYLGMDEIQNIQSQAAIQGGSSDSAFDRYQAYSKYLEKVRTNNLPGASCMMSIDMAGR